VRVLARQGLTLRTAWQISVVRPHAEHEPTAEVQSDHEKSHELGPSRGDGEVGLDECSPERVCRPNSSISRIVRRFL
jgi:hypothetical protein